MTAQERGQQHDRVELWAMSWRTHGPEELYGERFGRALPVVQGQYFQTGDNRWWTVGRVSWSSAWTDVGKQDYLVQTICLWPLRDQQTLSEDPRWGP